MSTRDLIVGEAALDDEENEDFGDEYEGGAPEDAGPSKRYDDSSEEDEEDDDEEAQREACSLETWIDCADTDI